VFGTRVVVDLPINSCRVHLCHELGDRLWVYMILHHVTSSKMRMSAYNETRRGMLLGVPNMPPPGAMTYSFLLFLLFVFFQ
jgi:hypothetical protein